MLLNGIWEFAHTFDETTPPVFDSFSPVPGCADAGKGSPRKRQRAFFRRQVEWPGGASRLSIDGLGLRGKIFWDGREIGSTELGYALEEFRFDAGTSGSHELQIVTNNFSHDCLEDQYLSLADFYVHTGIFGDVILEKAEPKTISHLAVTPLDHRTGEVKIQVEFFDAPPEKLNISFDGAPETEIPFSSEFNRVVPNFHLWSPEHPFLHTLSVNGKSVEFGIRTLDWSTRHLLLNGEPLKLIGVNRHECHPDFGAATPLALQAADLFKLKTAGFNFIRGSHYPQRQSFLALCDRLGILVWEETLGSGCTKEQLVNAEFQNRQVAQCEKMVRKSINHPSVVIWGFLNETATDLPCARPIITRLMKSIRKQDRSRPISFATFKPYTDICLDLPDILSFNVYPGWKCDERHKTEYDLDQVQPFLAELEKLNSDRPMIISEIGAAALIGDRSGLRWSEDYQAQLTELSVEYVLKSDRYSGIALWQFCDTASFISGEYVPLRPRGYNNKGLLDEYRRPKLAWSFLQKLLRKK